MLYDLSPFAGYLAGTELAPERDGAPVWFSNLNYILRWDGAKFRLERELPFVQVGSSELRLSGWYCGKPWYSGGSYYLFHDPDFTSSWVIAMFPPRPPKYWTDASGNIRGDSFWILSNFPTPESSSVGTWTGAGYSESDLEAVLVEEYLQSETLLGEYTDPAGVLSPRYIGVPKYLDQSGNEYIRSAELSDGYYTYGLVHFDGTRWCIGSEDDEEGYWTGSEPSRTSSTTFTYHPPEGTEIRKDDITLTFDSLTFPETPETLYLAEVAKWT